MAVTWVLSYSVAVIKPRAEIFPTTVSSECSLSVFTWVLSSNLVSSDPRTQIFHQPANTMTGFLSNSTNLHTSNSAKYCLNLCTSSVLVTPCFSSWLEFS